MVDPYLCTVDSSKSLHSLLWSTYTCSSLSFHATCCMVGCCGVGHGGLVHCFCNCRGDNPRLLSPTSMSFPVGWVSTSHWSIMAQGCFITMDQAPPLKSLVEVQRGSCSTHYFYTVAVILNFCSFTASATTIETTQQYLLALQFPLLQVECWPLTWCNIAHDCLNCMWLYSSHKPLIMGKERSCYAPLSTPTDTAALVPNLVVPVGVS